MARLRPFLLPGLFFLLMLAAAVLLWSVALPDLLFQIRIDLGNIVFLIGLAGAAGWISARLWLRWRLRRTVEIVQAQSADERRRFLRRLDHELKNPLTAIRAGLANLASAPNQDLRSEVITSIDAQTLRLSRLASDLRKLAELEIRPLELTQVDSASLLQEAFDLAESQPGAAGRSLRLTLPQAPWPLPHIQGDRDLLFLAVHNLLDNALKFSGAGNTIEMRAFEDGSSIVVEVADTGPGIPAEEIDQVWEELYRGQGARSIPGSGLGLSLVRAIVTRHGGQVGLRSRTGQGTVVTLRLPVSQ
ncbi:MAG: HAMP domain-containing sensor histidine kinase [Anaerolineaceae bacterium]|jgi:two-component system OmpR family sensor kinase